MSRPPNAATQTTDFLVSNLDYYSGIYSVNPVTGATNWQRFADHHIFAMTASNGRLYFSGWDLAGTRDHALICAEIASGNIVWKHTFSSNGSQLNICRQLAVCGNRVYGVIQNKLDPRDAVPGVIRDGRT